MARKKQPPYLKCSCGKVCPTTSVVMRCHDCGGPDKVPYGNVMTVPPAKLCRDCCPTGHGTKFPKE